MSSSVGLRVAGAMAIAASAVAPAISYASPRTASHSHAPPAAVFVPADVVTGSAMAMHREAVAPALFTRAEPTGVVPGTVIAVLSGTSVTREALREGSPALVPRTSNPSLNTALSRLGATSIQPLFARLPADAALALTAAARRRLGSHALNLGDIFLVHVDKSTSVAAASKLAATSGISFAEPDRYVETMDTGGRVLSATMAPRLTAADIRAVTPGSALLPSNYGLASSFDSYLNAQGVDLAGAYASLREKFGQLPGAGETITNISVGDLTDASMHDAEVATYGPTTLLRNGQRYIDLPTMPLIPAYVARPEAR